VLAPPIFLEFFPPLPSGELRNLSATVAFELNAITLELPEA
jgi:hypothetical protein